MDSDAAPPEEDFKPTTGTKKTTVKGTFGDYEVEHGLTRLHDRTRSPPWGEYTLKITMKPNAKTGTSTILSETYDATAPSSARAARRTELAARLR